MIFIANRSVNWGFESVIFFANLNEHDEIMLKLKVKDQGQKSWGIHIRLGWVKTASQKN